VSDDDFVWAGWIAVVFAVALICYAANIVYELTRGVSV
jgi:hypothetical protein